LNRPKPKPSSPPPSCASYTPITTERVWDPHIATAGTAEAEVTLAA